MRKLLVLLILVTTLSFGQGNPGISRTYSFQSATTLPAGGLNITGLNIGFLKAQWDVTGAGPATLSACTFTVDGSEDGVNWLTTHLATQNCVTDGQSAPFAILFNTSFIRVNVATFTPSFGTPVLSVNIAGWNEITGATSSNPLSIKATPNLMIGGTDSNNLNHTINTDPYGRLLFSQYVLGLPLVPCNALIRTQCTPKLPFQ